VVTPVGGSGKVPAFVSLLAPQKGMNVATLLDVQRRDRPLIEDLFKKKILKKKQVLLYADFLSQDEVDVEDVFERSFYVSLVNEEFKKELDQPNANEPRIVRAIESYLANHPLKFGSFGHYRPARYFSENAVLLWEQVSDATKDRFEAIFKQLNGLLK
jgi:hypothetical protein